METLLESLAVELFHETNCFMLGWKSSPGTCLWKRGATRKSSHAFRFLAVMQHVPALQSPAFPVLQWGGLIVFSGGVFTLSWIEMSTGQVVALQDPVILRVVQGEMSLFHPPSRWKRVQSQVDGVIIERLLEYGVSRGSA